MWDWLNCVVFSRHENAVWCEDGAMFLRCMRCGHRSRGWDVDGHDEGHGSRLVAATAERRLPVLGRLKA
jgi:hypothetical protein